MVSGIAGFGDIAVVIDGWTPAWAWRTGDAFAKPDAPAGIGRDPRWWVAALVCAAAFVGVLGPTITFT